MKTLIITLLLSLTVLMSQAQSIQTSTYLERTHFSPKMGTSLGFEFENQFEAGGFYQKAVDNNLAQEGSPAIIEEEFLGAYIACPLMMRRTTSLKINIRTGVSNGENFVITPSILAKYQPIPQISFGGGFGVRAFRPTLMASVCISLAKPQMDFVAMK